VPGVIFKATKKVANVGSLKVASMHNTATGNLSFKRFCNIETCPASDYGQLEHVAHDLPSEDGSGSCAPCFDALDGLMDYWRRNAFGWQGSQRWE
jgi:hypothetical protein